MSRLKVISIINPFDLSDRIVDDIEFTGQNLSDIINKYASGMAEVIVHINQTRLDPVEKDKYDLALRPGDEIVLIPAVRDVVGGIIAVAS